MTDGPKKGFFDQINDFIDDIVDPLRIERDTFGHTTADLYSPSSWWDDDSSSSEGDDSSDGGDWWF